MGNNFRYMPLVPLRGLVLYPYTTLNFDAGRDISVRAMETAVNGDSIVLLVAQSDINAENPTENDIYKVGTVARIKQIMRMPGGVTRVIAEGLKRGKIHDITGVKPYIRAYVEEINEEHFGGVTFDEAYAKELKKAFEAYFSQAPKLNAELFMQIMATNDLVVLTDTIASRVDLRTEVKQELLE